MDGAHTSKEIPPAQQNHPPAPATPIRMIRASSLVNHADGSYSHTSYRRPMTPQEIERERHPPVLRPEAPIVYPDGIPDGYGHDPDQPIPALWRQFAKLLDCFFLYKRAASGTHQPYVRRHPRMAEEHWYGPGQYGHATHFAKFLPETPEQDASYSQYFPTMGLHRDDLSAFYRAQRGPLEKIVDHMFVSAMHWFSKT